MEVMKISASVLGIIAAFFFARAVLSGRAGKLGKSILFAVIAMFVGCVMSLGQGTPDKARAAVLLVIFGNALLSVASVLIGRYLFHRSKR